MTTDLLVQLRRGDSRAWESFYDSHATDLRSYIARLGARDVDDILGETMVQVVRDIKKFRGDDAGLRPWTFRIAHHRVIDAARANARRPVDVTDMFDDDSQSHLAPLSDVPDTGELSALLNELTPDQRAAVWLRHVAGFSLEDAAGVLDKTPDAVASLTFRGLRQLRKLLQSS